MLSLVVSRSQIAEAQDMLETTMRREFPDRERRTIIFPSSYVDDAQVWTDSRHWYRRSFLDDSEGTTPRNLNWFGKLGSGYLRISLEANVVPEGTNSRVQGFFARNNASGALYLMHSGRVGGGARGVGGRAFRAWYGEPRIEVFNAHGKNRFGYSVMQVDALAPTRSLVRFLDRVDAFRQAVRFGRVQIHDPAFQQEMQAHDDFYREPRGRRTWHGPGQVDYLSRHGEVVDALQEWRETRGIPSQGRIVKTVFVDMGVKNASGAMVELYEVKTSASRSDVYSAIGQLMVHGLPGCTRTVVLPAAESIRPDLLEAFERHQIQLLRFNLDEEKAAIVGDGRG